MSKLLTRMLRAFIICAFASALMLLNTANMYSLASKATVAACKTGGSKPCGECPDGTKPYGTGPIICDKVGMSTIDDFGLKMELTNTTSSAQQSTSIFILSEDESDTLLRGGFIGVTVVYDHYVERWDEYVNSYTLCGAIGIKDYDEWLAACELYYDISIPSDLVIVYPNPTSGEASIIIKDVYSSFVKSASYQLISPSGSYLTTLVPSNPTDRVDIPAMHLTTIGAYTIICNIEYMDVNNTLKQTSFSVSLMVN